MRCIASIVRLTTTQHGRIVIHRVRHGWRTYPILWCKSWPKISVERPVIENAVFFGRSTARLPSLKRSGAGEARQAIVWSSAIERKIHSWNCRNRSATERVTGIIPKQLTLCVAHIAGIPTSLEADMVRAEGIEPSRPCGLRIFVPLRLSPPRWRVRGLDYTFTVPRAGFRCRPSSLYTFPEPDPGLARDCHCRFPRL